MEGIHIEFQGKSGSVWLQWLPPARPRPTMLERTSSGMVSPFKVTTGISTKVDPFQVKPEEIIQGDPELDFEQGGQVLDPESLSTAYYDPVEPEHRPVPNFTMTDVVYDAQGLEKERRPHLTRKPNIADIYPIKIGKRIPLLQALKQFVFKRSYQIVHQDGVTMDFLYGIAKDLHEKQEMAVLGAGPKGTQPLVMREKGNPYRALLYGEIGTGKDADKYKLLLLLSDQELKRPQAAPSAQGE